jgi:hypothetical protein
MMDRPAHQYAYAKLFVTGIPRRIPLAEVERFFQRYAQVRLSDYKMSMPTESDQENKGFCFLECYRAEDAFRLAQMYEFDFYGRTLTATRSKSGMELVVYNRRLNKCRLILKRVPSCMCQAQITKQIEDKYGPVAKIFHFLPNIARLGGVFKKVKKHLTYSVLMQDPSSAAAMWNDGQIIFDSNISISVERYRKPPIPQASKPPRLDGHMDASHTGQARVNEPGSWIRHNRHLCKPCERGYHIHSAKGDEFKTRVDPRESTNFVFRINKFRSTIAHLRSSQM